MQLSTKKVILPFLILAFVVSPNVAFGADNYEITFDGINDYVDVGNNAELDLDTNFEISFSFKTTFSIAGGHRIINRIDAGDLYENYWLVEYNGLSNRFVIELGSGGLLYSRIITDATTPALNDGEFHDIVWTRTGDVQTVTVDGIDRTQVEWLDAGIGSGINTAENVYIGGDFTNNDTYFNGSLDYLQIDSSGVCVARWDFNEGISPVGDTCGSNNDSGVVSGALFTLLAPIVAPVTGFRFMSAETGDNSSETLTSNVSSAVGSIFPIALLWLGIVLAFYIITRVIKMFDYNKQRKDK